MAHGQSQVMEPFPPSSDALEDPNGLLAVGGDLTPERLGAAYERGIFPWFEEGQPILWWTPDPRSVLYPEAFHLSRSLRKTLRKAGFTLSCNRQFEAVMRHCAAPRRDGHGTWISEQMVTAYTALHARGQAHSIEVSLQGALVGGLYGVSLGTVFFGESMFSLVPDASKVALASLVWLAREGWFSVIDCQVESEHLNSLGAQNISREAFENQLRKAINTPMRMNPDQVDLPPGADTTQTPLLPEELSVPPWTTRLPQTAADLLEDGRL